MHEPNVKKSADMSTQTEVEAVVGTTTTLNIVPSNPESPFQFLSETSLRLSGSSMSNILPYHGQSIRNRKRGPTDLSASMELSGLLRNSSEHLLGISGAFSLKSSTDSFSHSSAFNHPYQATIIPQLTSAQGTLPPYNLQNPRNLFYSSPYGNPGKELLSE